MQRIFVLLAQELQLYHIIRVSDRKEEQKANYAWTAQINLLISMIYCPEHTFSKFQLYASHQNLGVFVV